MRNLLRVTSRLNNNIEKSTIRIFSNYELHRFSTEEKLSRKSRIKKPIDESTRLAIEAIKKFGSRQSALLGKYLRILDKDVAKQFADMIISSPAVNPLYVAEINPGLGLLTTHLLDAGIPRIHIFENLEYFYPNLECIAEKYPGRVCLKKVTFGHLWYLSYMDWTATTKKLQTFFEGLQKRTWQEEPTFHIIGVLPNFALLSRFMSAIIYHHSLASYGRMVLHVAMPPSMWDKLSSSNDNYKRYTSRTILFQILFRYELLGTVPRTAFYPKYGRRFKRNFRYTKHLRYDSKLMNVVRIEARNDLHKHKLTEKDIVPLCYFIKHHYKKRRNRIIPELEKWIPGCGRPLIAEGYNVTIEFGDLLPDEIIKLFLLFKSWPEYKTCSFTSMMDTFPMRMDEQIVFGTNSDKVDEMFKLSRESTNAQTDSNKSENQNKSLD